SASRDGRDHGGAAGRGGRAGRQGARSGARGGRAFEAGPRGGRRELVRPTGGCAGRAREGLSGWKAGRWSYDGESLPGDGARGGVGPPRKRGAVGATDRDGAADRVRQRSGRRGRGSGRHSAERRTQDADGAGGDTSSAMGARSRLPIPGVRADAIRRSASRGALGEGRGDEPRQSAVEEYFGDVSAEVSNGAFDASAEVSNCASAEACSRPPLEAS